MSLSLKSLQKTDPELQALYNYFSVPVLNFFTLEGIESRLKDEIRFLEHHRPKLAEQFLTTKLTRSIEAITTINSQIDALNCAILVPIIRKCIAEQNPELILDQLDFTRFSEQLWDIPDIATYLNTQLKLLSCNQNFLHTLPRSLRLCVKLEDIWCTHNVLVYLPDEISQIKPLRRLFVSNNHLSAIPFGVISSLGDREQYKVYLRCYNNFIPGFIEQWHGDAKREVLNFLPLKKDPKHKEVSLIEHAALYTPQWIQKTYETREDKRRLGRMIGGSVTVSKAEKENIIAARKNKK